MEWLCPVCESINNHIFIKALPSNENEYMRKKKFCKTCYFKRDDSNWETHIQMNELIDQHLPRHQLDIPLSYALVRVIHPRKWFLEENTLNYIKQRVYCRNKPAWRNWRRNTFYRKFVKRILDKWQSANAQQIEHSLVLQYLF